MLIGLAVTEAGKLYYQINPAGSTALKEQIETRGRYRTWVVALKLFMKAYRQLERWADMETSPRV